MHQKIGHARLVRLGVDLNAHVCVGMRMYVHVCTRMRHPPWLSQMPTPDASTPEMHTSAHNLLFHKLGFGQAFDGGSCTLRERLDQPGFLMRHPSWRSKFPTPDASTEPAIVIVPSSQFTSTSSVWGELLMGEGHVHLESDSVILIQRRASRSICRKKLCHWLQHPNGNLRRCPRVQP